MKKPRLSRIARILLGVACMTILAALFERFVLRRRSVEAAPTEADWASGRLREFEADRHRATDFSKVVPWNASSGPDPYLIRTVPGQARLVGILRGDDALVV